MKVLMRNLRNFVPSHQGRTKNCIIIYNYLQGYLKIHFYLMYKENKLLFKILLFYVMYLEIGDLRLSKERKAFTIICVPFIRDNIF